MSTMYVATVKKVVIGTLTSAMFVAAIFRTAGLNDIRGYYHCSDGLKYARGYNNLPSRCYCAFLYLCVFSTNLN
jgi:hypothetical protein